MFGWLADLLIKTPVQGSGCSCCEAKKEQLKQMQKQILDENITSLSEESCNCCEQNCDNRQEQEKECMVTSCHYKL